MFTVSSQHKVSLMALRTYWYEELRILRAILNSQLNQQK